MLRPYRLASKNEVNHVRRISEIQATSIVEFRDDRVDFGIETINMGEKSCHRLAHRDTLTSNGVCERASAHEADFV